ncbi:hypothetical protein JD844_013452 [Phrynosoma platyrhinos]|uniref:Uncharacterized protein n=1 Tax=Phrynosoma platyrhinos TaxID=52577 RepID=A0ABQ7TMP2_PHRPL|nr:hypothetical protein JD844_013452 [Phrynosoma platyrhinos]
MVLLQDESYSSSIKEHLVAGLQELMSIAGVLLLPWPHNEEICAKTRDHVSSASHRFSEAEQKLESRLLLVDSQSEALIAMKKLMQDDLQEKNGNLADLRAQIVVFKEAQKKSQAMLEVAELHLENTKDQLRSAHEEVAKNRAGREIGSRMLILPGFGSLIGIGMVVGYQAALDSAENLVAEAQRSVALCTAEVNRYRNEIAQLSQKEQEVQAGINATDQKILQIQAECDEILAFHNAVTTQQSSIRKCLSLLDLLGGKIHAAAVMSRHACIPGFLVDILEEIAGVVEGQDGVAFCGNEEIQASVLEIKNAVKSLKGRAGGSTSIAY